MKIITFSDLYKTEFYLTQPYAENQTSWYSAGNFYSCINSPKPSHTLLWLKECDVKVTDKTGYCISARKGDLLYMAKGLEYIVEFYNTAENRVDSVVIHFQLYDSQHNEFCMADRPVICLKNIDIKISMELELLVNEFEKNVFCMPAVLSSLYRILSEISISEHKNISHYKYNCIRKGIEILESNGDMKIKDIANLCGMSESYFRNVFREYSGKTPAKFRQIYRIERAKLLLASDMYSIKEIAEKLYFSDSYHFSKTFKSLVGISPGKFCKELRGQTHAKK